MTKDVAIPQPGPDELGRLQSVLKAIGGDHVVWGAESILDLWVIEQRALQDAAISRRLLVASWALVCATVALVLATMGLVFFAAYTLPACHDRLHAVSSLPGSLPLLVS